MMKETEDIVHMKLDFLPLKTAAHIVEGNALQIDWSTVVPQNQLSYICGNPPFVGARMMKEGSAQKKDMVHVFGENWKNLGDLDYVCAWYKRATEMMEGTEIKSALVSTNSVCQGSCVSNLWKPLFDAGVHIDFAHRTFRWDSEATIKAHVHCIIVGFSFSNENNKKVIFDDEQIIEANHINAYLIDTDDVFVSSRTKPLCDVPPLLTGSQRIDDDTYMFTTEEKIEFIKKEPSSERYFRIWYGADEFINNRPRWVLYLGKCTPAELRSMPKCMELVEKVRAYRLSSTRTQTLKAANYPNRFGLEVIPDGDFMIVPVVSSERRRYIPLGFMKPDVMCSNQVNLIPDATIYHFGVLTSNVHMAWVRTVCGRLKSDYRYSKDIVYNNFPWPEPNEEQKAKIEKTAQAILDARDLFPDSSFADLYDELTMPMELRTAHYGMPIKETDEAACVAWLMRLYKEKTSMTNS